MPLGLYGFRPLLGNFLCKAAVVGAGLTANGGKGGAALAAAVGRTAAAEPAPLAGLDGWAAAAPGRVRNSTL